MALKGLKEADLAKYAGCSQVAISRVINGSLYSYRIRKAIADILGVKYEELWS